MCGKICNIKNLVNGQKRLIAGIATFAERRKGVYASTFPNSGMIFREYIK